MEQQPAAVLAKRFLATKSAWFLVAANLVPVWGVVFAGWQTFDVVFVFWVENVIIGLLNVAKILSSSLGGLFSPAAEDDTGMALRGLKSAGGVFVAGFFTVHYGMFCFVHGVFVVSLLGPKPVTGFPNPFARALSELDGPLRYAILALVLSHGFSFVANFLRGGEFKRVRVEQLMKGPYGRVVVLHLAIIFGAFASLALGSGLGILLILIAGKIVLDVRFHLAERERGAASL